jgi:hypothetical protein
LHRRHGGFDTHVFHANPTGPGRDSRACSSVESAPPTSGRSQVRTLACAPCHRGGRRLVAQRQSTRSVAGGRGVRHPARTTVIEAEGDEAPGCDPGRSRCESGRSPHFAARDSPAAGPTRAVRQPTGTHNPGRRGSAPRRATATTSSRTGRGLCHDGHEAACKAVGTGFDSRASLHTVCSAVPPHVAPARSSGIGAHHRRPLPCPTTPLRAHGVPIDAAPGTTLRVRRRARGRHDTGNSAADTFPCSPLDTRT